MSQAAHAAQPLSVFFFDLLHCDGIDLLDAPTTERLAALDALVPAAAPGRPAGHLRRRCAAADFLDATLAAGHEGVMAKSPGRALPGGPARSGLAEGQAGAHTRPGGARRGVGLGAAPRQTVQHPPGRPRSGHRRIRHGGQDFQGHDRRDAGLADRAVHRARRRRRPTATSSNCGPSRWSRSRSTACRDRRATPAVWRCGSPGCVRYRDDKSPAEADTIDTVRALY